jgi:hypothetical protein
VLLLIKPDDPTTNPVIESRNDIPSVKLPAVPATGVLQLSPPSVVLTTPPFCKTACTTIALMATNDVTGFVVVKTVVQVVPPSVVLMIVPADPLAAPAAMYPVFASANEID